MTDVVDPSLVIAFYLYNLNHQLRSYSLRVKRTMMFIADYEREFHDNY